MSTIADFPEFKEVCGKVYLNTIPKFPVGLLMKHLGISRLQVHVRKEVPSLLEGYGCCFDVISCNTNLSHLLKAGGYMITSKQLRLLTDEDELDSVATNTYCVYRKRLDTNEYDLFTTLDNLPQESYKQRGPDFRNFTHAGQRKLFLQEIRFLVRHYRPEHTVVYIGAAPGIHIPLLYKFIPTMKMITYDPSEMREEVKKIKGMKIYKKFFTDEDAEHLASQADVKYLLISDIRSVRTGASKTEIDTQVRLDQSNQKKWYHIIKPDAALLKFRLPWDDEKTVYLNGIINVQPYAPMSSTECRLEVIAGDDADVIYDNREYEEKMFYFNKIRALRYKMKIDVGDALKNNFDGATECQILYDCIMRFEGGEEPSADTMRRWIKLIDKYTTTVPAHEFLSAYRKTSLKNAIEKGYAPARTSLIKSNYDNYVVPNYTVLVGKFNTD